MGWKDKHYPELQHLMWFLAYMSEKQWLAHVWLAMTDLTGDWLTGDEEKMDWQSLLPCTCFDFGDSIHSSQNAGNCSRPPPLSPLLPACPSLTVVTPWWPSADFLQFWTAHRAGCRL
jgi:hypothetical protein